MSVTPLLYGGGVETTLPRFAVVDVETSGLRPRRDHVLQIAVVIVEADGTVVDCWSTLVRPRRWWHRVGPRHIHGITRRALRSAPRADEAYAELARRIGDSVVAAHNALFDAEFLQRAAGRAGVSLPLGRVVCTLELSRRLDPDRQQYHGLADLCTRYGVELNGHHDALVDATATAAVLPHLLSANGVTDVADLDALTSILERLA
jgi:DNA polymerase III epsilon subunit-like protein